MAKGVASDLCMDVTILFENSSINIQQKGVGVGVLGGRDSSINRVASKQHFEKNTNTYNLF